MKKQYDLNRSIALLILYLLFRMTVFADALIGTVDVPANSHISAAVYDGSGRKIRELKAYEPTGSNTGIELRWDGKDEFGEDVSPDNYQWRALATEAVFFEEGSIGNTGCPWAKGIMHNGNVDDIVFDSSGNCYTVSYWEEAHTEIRKLDSNWKIIWQTALVGPHRAAADDEKLYVAALVDKQDRIYIYNSADGKGGSFFVINELSRGSGPDPAIRGLDVDSQRLWIADHYNERVLVYSKSTRKQIGQFSITKPNGIAVEPASKQPGSDYFIWISHENQVSRYSVSPSFDEFKQVDAITALNDPASLEIGGPGNHLFIVEKGNDRILEYDISSTPVPAGKFHKFGTGFTPGHLADDEFYQLNDIAVAPDGRAAVSDAGNFRIQLFSPDKKLLFSEHVAWQPAPYVDKITTSTHRLLTLGFEYEVDLSGKTHPDWMAGGGDRTWRLIANWWDRPWATMFYWRRITFDVPGLGKRDYLFCMNKQELAGFCIYQVSPDGADARRCAIVARRWLGENGQIQPGDVLARWSWKDSSGDGQIQESEVTWQDPKGEGRPFTLWCPSMVTDHKGNLYYAMSEAGTRDGEAQKIPLLGFDKIGNPLYAWDKAVHLVSEDETEGNFKPQEIRVALDGEIFLLGSTTYAKQDPILWMGGPVIRRYDPEGKFLFEYLASAREKVFSGMEIDPASDSVAKLWTGMHTNGSRVAAWTEDGLMLVHCKPTRPPFDKDWLDNGAPIYVFTLPGADPGQRYIYTEGVVSAAAMRMRVEKLDHVKRFEKTFRWPLSKSSASGGSEIEKNVQK